MEVEKKVGVVKWKQSDGRHGPPIYTSTGDYSTKANIPHPMNRPNCPSPQAPIHHRSTGASWLADGVFVSFALFACRLRLSDPSRLSSSCAAGRTSKQPILIRDELWCSRRRSDQYQAHSVSLVGRITLLVILILIRYRPERGSFPLDHEGKGVLSVRTKPI